MKIWIVRGTNSDATQYYLDVLEETCIVAGYEVEQINNVECTKNYSKNDIYWVITCIDFLKIYFKYKKKNCFLWMQGIAPEESYMNHHSNLRKVILGQIEKFALKKSKFVIFVSNEMVRHCKKKYRMNFSACYVMPCFNAEINESIFQTKGKYENNLFCYAGSLSVWQGIDTILECYKKIENWNIPNTKLLVLTEDKEKAKEMMDKYGIKKYCIDYVLPSELPEAMKEVKFGFVIREDTTVNRVSTPTKISTYMGNGIIPIYSNCIRDFSQEVRGYTYVLEYESEEFENKLKNMMSKTINCEDVLHEYQRIFAEYYCRRAHVFQLANKIKEISAVI